MKRSDCLTSAQWICVFKFHHMHPEFQILEPRCIYCSEFNTLHFKKGHPIRCDMSFVMVMSVSTPAHKYTLLCCCILHLFVVFGFLHKQQLLSSTLLVFGGIGNGCLTSWVEMTIIKLYMFSIHSSRNRCRWILTTWKNSQIWLYPCKGDFWPQL